MMDEKRWTRKEIRKAADAAVVLERIMDRVIAELDKSDKPRIRDRCVVVHDGELDRRWAFLDNVSNEEFDIYVPTDVVIDWAKEWSSECTTVVDFLTAKIEAYTTEQRDPHITTA